MSIEELLPARAAQLETHSILVAGGETAALLSGSLYRCMAEIAPDQVLEVISPEPRARTEIPEWCRMTGNELLHVHENEDETLFWIRKTGRGAAGPAGFPFAVGDDVHGPDVERRTEVGRDT